MDYILLIIGFLFLIKGADIFVDGSSNVAKIFKVPSVIIGLTIVAMGTSAPEASVSISAGLMGNNDIAIANVIGSNIFNLLGVVGLCALLMPFNTDKSILKRDLPINIIISIILVVMFIDSKLSFFDGLLLVLMMVVYIISMIKEAKNHRAEEENVEVMSLSKSIIFILIGLALVIFGGNVVVKSASNIAYSLGLSENLVGLTIVAIGTSLPELVTSLVAVYKKETGLALGNAVGSNIFNILFILGASSMISPLTVNPLSTIDAGFMIFVGIIMYIFAKTKTNFSKTEGLISVLLYIAYTAYLIIR